MCIRDSHKIPSHSIIKTPDQIAGIKESAKINVAVLDYIGAVSYTHLDVYKRQVYASSWRHTAPAAFPEQLQDPSDSALSLPVYLRFLQHKRSFRQISQINRQR